VKNRKIDEPVTHYNRYVPNFIYVDAKEDGIICRGKFETMV